MHRITIQYGAPADSEAFEKHYTEVHIPLRLEAAEPAPLRAVTPTRTRRATLPTSSPSCGSTTPMRSRRR